MMGSFKSKKPEDLSKGVKMLIAAISDVLSQKDKLSEKQYVQLLDNTMWKIVTQLENLDKLLEKM